MFNEYYDYVKIQRIKGSTNEPFLFEHKFAFRAKNNHRYIVNVEEYEYQIFVVKFHLKEHANSVNKYKIVSNFGDTSRIINTCLHIMIDMYKEYPKASFGFIGVDKRYPIYKRIMENVFSPNKFVHINEDPYNAYLLFNKNSETTQNNVSEMFERVYVINLESI